MFRCRPSAPHLQKTRLLRHARTNSLRLIVCGRQSEMSQLLALRKASLSLNLSPCALALLFSSVQLLSASQDVPALDGRTESRSGDLESIKCEQVSASFGQLNHSRSLPATTLSSQWTPSSTPSSPPPPWSPSPSAAPPLTPRAAEVERASAASLLKRAHARTWCQFAAWIFTITRSSRLLSLRHRIASAEERGDFFWKEMWFSKRTWTFSTLTRRV
ncbi:hypothetical protein BV25DRAFT_314824 [Artomyces pyxidatus]|uniref:Uncharacterized protein n=1 Tax=Artomyces pyxidatus TaxID=48021 RepID=A0ACB8T764_9AGAM|nr:hypothetical protein BV25DRAFT_314824 [Artomyces pyxidatus]